MARRIRVRAAAVPKGVWLAAIVVVSSVCWSVLSHRIVAPWIMTDELTYTELARSFAEHGRFLIRGVPANNYGFVYPILIAPAWALFGSAADAYQASKIIDSIVMSLAAIPAYFLARKLMRPNLALVAAGFSVIVPGMLYTGTLMTETAFYPIFLTVALALYTTLDRPTRRNQIVLVAICLVAYLTRAQAVALLAATALAPVVLVLIDRRPFWRGLRPFVTLYAILAGGLILALLGSAARGGKPSSLLGAYRKALGSNYSVHDVLQYFVWHVGGLGLAMGVIPAVALYSMWFAPRSISPPARVFVAMSLPVAVVLVAEVAAFASAQALRIEERNMFYLVPIGVIALLGAIGDRATMPSAWPPRLAAAALAVIPAFFIPFSNASVLGAPAVSDTFSLLPWWWVKDHGVAAGQIRVVVVIAGAMAAALFLLVPRRLIAVLPVLIAAYFVLTSVVVQNGRHGMDHASIASVASGIHTRPKNWIEEAIGRPTPVAYLWSGHSNPHTIWDNEFFSRNPTTVYALNGGGPDPLPTVDVTSARGGELHAEGNPVYAPYIVSDGTTAIKGKPVAADPGLGLTLYHVTGPVIQSVRVTGLYPNDTWSGKTVVYRREYCTGGHLTTLLYTDPLLFKANQVVTAFEGGRRVARVSVAPNRIVKLPVTLRPVNGLCTVRYETARTLVPAVVSPSVSNDSRALGVHFSTFGYSP